MPKKKNFKLENKIYIFPNKDKKFHEKWTKERRPLNIPHPFRAVLLGKPNSGKTLISKNLILHQRPKFQKIYLIHCDAKFTKEWDDVGVSILEDIPDPTWWPGKVKTLVIIDDAAVNKLSKEQDKNLDRLFGFCSTHKNISVIITQQDAFKVPVSVRRNSNLWILWKADDLDSTDIIRRRVGIKKEKWEELFGMIKSNHDSVWIDLTNKSPYKLRFNGVDIVD